MGAWQFLVPSAGKAHAHEIPPFRGGGGVVLGFLEGGGCGCANFIFMGVGIFPTQALPNLRRNTYSLWGLIMYPQLTD